MRSTLISLTCHAGILFQWPGFLIAALAGAGVANFLKDPAPWLRGIIAGQSAHITLASMCIQAGFWMVFKATLSMLDLRYSCASE